MPFLRRSSGIDGKSKRHALLSRKATLRKLNLILKSPPSPSCFSPPASPSTAAAFPALPIVPLCLFNSVHLNRQSLVVKGVTVTILHFPEVALNEINNL